jgi:hypothetical protein
MKKASLMNVPATFESMAQSSFFLVLGEGDVVQEIRDKGDCYQQILMARALKKPVVLMLDRQLRPLEQGEMRNCLEGLEIIGTVFFDSEKMDDRVKDELRELLGSWKKTRGVHNS